MRFPHETPEGVQMRKGRIPGRGPGGAFGGPGWGPGGPEGRGRGRGFGPGGPGGRGGRGPGGRGGRFGEREVPSADGVESWFAGRLPDAWFTGAVEVVTDRDEITVVGVLPAPETGADDDETAVAAAEAGRIARFREDTREARMAIADEAEQRYGRSVAWGAQAGGTRQVFTNISVPVMTRLRQDERRVLDTLVDSGVARSRSEALAWCVRLVSSNADSWLSELREAMQAVQKVREQGPTT